MNLYLEILNCISLFLLSYGALLGFLRHKKWKDKLVYGLLLISSILGIYWPIEAGLITVNFIISFILIKQFFRNESNT